MQTTYPSCIWVGEQLPLPIRNTELWKKQKMIQKLPHSKSLVEDLSLTITMISFLVYFVAASAHSAFCTLQPQHGFVVLSKTTPITPCVCTLAKLLNQNTSDRSSSLSLHRFTSHLLPRFHQEERSQLHNPLAGRQIMLGNAGAVAHQILSAESELLFPHYCWDWIWAANINKKRGWTACSRISFCPIGNHTTENWLKLQIK